MFGDIGELALAATIFVLSHVGISSTPLRSWLLGHLGERLYLGLYSLLSALLLVWVVMAWQAAPVVVLWEPLTFWRHLPYGVMAICCVLLVGGQTAPNPSLAGRPVAGGWHPQGVLTVTRHPMLWAIGLWALVHIPANGDLASLVLFASMAGLAFAGILSIERRKAREAPALWQAVRAQTSILPLLALLQGRARLGPVRPWAVAGLGGLVLYVIFILVHPFIAGVAVPSPFS